MSINRATICPLAKRHPNGVSLLRRADSAPRLDDGWAKALPAVVLIFDQKTGPRLRLIRQTGRSQESNPGPGLTYATGDVILLFVVMFLGYNQYWRGGFMFFVALCTADVILVCGRVPWLYQYWPGGFMGLW